MVLNTITVGAAVAPTVVRTYVTHYLDRKPRKQRPTAHITYDEGLALIRCFLTYASLHTVEELQAFTSQWVPSPRWVKVDEVTIPEKVIISAAEALTAQLGHKGIDKIGGRTWWQWRRENTSLKAEWIEMRNHYQERKRTGDKGKRVMLYVHGGAYFFGSVDEHRYQMQRHARKLKARVFARGLISHTRYRLAPQFPFPCGLLDCLAAYMFLLETQDPSTIILAGDSAGGGMVMSMLVTLRDQNIPLPAGSILISPWVDLTHSFPSVAEENNPYDYIPTHGFLQKPSRAWPPPNADDMQHIAELAITNAVKDAMPRKSTQQEKREAVHAALHDISDHRVDAPTSSNPKPAPPIPGTRGLEIEIDGKRIEIKDQIQLYACNSQLNHPLVSPVLQPSLGGLPPLLILTGGGEVLRDEQIYIAHKAANPSKYPPSDAYLAEHPEAREELGKFPPTYVQLQVWDDLCHVAPTLSFTPAAKFMFRSICQFGAWALARAQMTEIEILDDDDISVISTQSDSGSDVKSEAEKPLKDDAAKQNGIARNGMAHSKQIGKAGDPLPSFRNHMIRQRVDRHGYIYPLQSQETLPALSMSPNEIGVIKPGPVRKWMAAKHVWDTKFAKEKRTVQRKRVKEMARGYRGFGDDEVPPPSALAGRRKLDYVGKEPKKRRSLGMSLWSLWGSSHDEKTISREEKLSHTPETSTADPTTSGANARSASAPNTTRPHSSSVPIDSNSQSRPILDAQSRSRSRRRVVTDLGQTNGDVNENTTAAELLALREKYASTTSSSAVGGAATRITAPSPDRSPAPQSPAGMQNRERPGPLNLDGGLQSPGLLSPYTMISPREPLSPMSREPEPGGFEGRKTTPNRPTAGGVAFPFKIRLGGEVNASTCTLVGTPGLQEHEGRQLGVDSGAGNKDVGEEMGLESRNGHGKALGEVVSVEEERGRSAEESHVPVAAAISGEEEGVKTAIGDEVPQAVNAQDTPETKNDDPVEPGENMERPGYERFETAREVL